MYINLMTQSTCNEQSASIAQLGDRPIKLAATRLCYTPYTAATEPASKSGISLSSQR